MSYIHSHERSSFEPIQICAFVHNTSKVMYETMFNLQHIKFYTIGIFPILYEEYLESKHIMFNNYGA